ncbi:MAG: DUF971 domain-containing protein [Halieaceae bacterium]|jgi:DUF971 family protein|nr:DUF971 domain-containing protein [Halieaceae bacterium]MDG1828438.1 DUF971 domain-containing protein [Luminiphilus sp.]MBT5209725.1 DUF971 domain-containing protein [Halieaceae bacterium]MBT6263624.1 DUF971 domain-containing protein [Halieaceae bacterium]MBT6333948.1 DUF971 domain-containing protein [Halieaceae bacterium]
MKPDDPAHRVDRIHYARNQRTLDLSFDDGLTGSLSAEFLRVFSPSAEVRGHGPGQEVLQAGKAGVQITAINPVGHYAVQLVFDDGHDSGLYSWSYLHDLISRQTHLWRNYIARLDAAGLGRDADTQVLMFQP